MVANPNRSVCFVSSFLPQQCGIANFTNDLINAIRANVESFSPFVVAVRGSESVRYADPVKFEIRRDVEGDYWSAADYINFSPAHVVSLQHEYGLFGGEQGNYLLLLLRQLRVPVVTTLHTVLRDPLPEFRKVFEQLMQMSDRVIVMSRRGEEFLRQIYGVPDDKIDFIPHGIPTSPSSIPAFTRTSLTPRGSACC